MELSIVIPVYNSENSIVELVDELHEVIKSIDFEVILVDDRSRDESFSRCVSLARRYGNVTAMRLSKNYGQQNAILAGVRLAKADYIVTMDDDKQHSPEDVIRLYNEILRGGDIVYGIDFYEEVKGHRMLGSKMVAWTFNKLFIKKKDLRVSSFRIFNKKMKDVLSSYLGSFVYISAIMLFTKPDIKNINIQKKKRKYGKSNYSLRKLMRLYFNIYVYYSGNKFLESLQNDKEQYDIEVICSEENNDIRSFKGSVERYRKNEGDGLSSYCQ